MFSMALVIGGALVALLVGIAIGRSRGPERTIVWRGEPRAVRRGAANVHDPEIDHLLRSDRLIEAIKRHRDLTGLGLKASKDAMEARRRELRCVADDGGPFCTPEDVCVAC